VRTKLAQLESSTARPPSTLLPPMRGTTSLPRPPPCAPQPKRARIQRLTARARDKSTRPLRAPRGRCGRSGYWTALHSYARSAPWIGTSLVKLASSRGHSGRDWARAEPPFCTASQLPARSFHIAPEWVICAHSTANILPQAAMGRKSL
jgi:hypothetical protein